ncbi:MAG TPA: SpoIIE family protein phosphatase [Candidatus Angelobacter sp.]|nr:SpoIIE family protein phosphatase [Candidatus Angelobacter sp.]
MGIQVTDLHLLRDQLLLRREKLQAAAARSQTANLVQLLEQVDKALEKTEQGRFGECDVCQGTVEQARLMADPVTSVCLDCLKPSEQRALEQDLALAARIQAGLLPRVDVNAAGWRVAYHYEPAHLVSGDYCDVVPHGKHLYFMVGDVSGKGVAASMLMANLHAMFRVLIPSGLPLPQLVERANRIFSDSTLPSQYATLVVGHAGEDGEVEICNGGHLAPLHLQAVAVNAVGAAALPVGMFHDQEFASTRVSFAPGDSLVIYTDGFTEAQGQDGAEYGAQRLGRILQGRHGDGPRQLVDACVSDLAAFRNGSPKIDDQTLMALSFAPVQH